MRQKYYKNRYCKCGCGRRIEVKKCHKYRDIPKYVHGHNCRIRFLKEKKCKNCNKKIINCCSKCEYKNLKFCSSICYFLWKKNRSIKTGKIINQKFCKFCGIKIYRRKYFCNKICYGKWKKGKDKNGNLRKENKKCMICKKLMYRSKLKSNVTNKYWKKRKFCSPKCHYQWQTGRKNDGSGKFMEIKKLRKCKCGCGETLKSMFYYLGGNKVFCKYCPGHYPKKKETRRKISICQIGRKLLKSSIKKRTETRRENGWLKNPEKTKRKMSKVRKGIEFSNSHIHNLSVATTNYIRSNGLLLPVNVGINEKEILDACEKEFGTKIIRSHQINHFFVDGYSKDLNIVFEVDEKYHLRHKERDFQRQKEIQEELCCKFIRVLDY